MTSRAVQPRAARAKAAPGREFHAEWSDHLAEMAQTMDYFAEEIGRDDPGGSAFARAAVDIRAAQAKLHKFACGLQAVTTTEGNQ